MTKQERRVHSLKKKAARTKLDAPQSFWMAPLSDLARLYNGCGPDWMGKFTRKALTFAMRIFEPAILIHDYRFEFADGSRESFDEANSEFYANCKRLSFASFKWYEPERYKWLLRAFAAWRFCVRGGWSAWIDATT